MTDGATLYRLNKIDGISQRALAKQFGISLGKVQRRIGKYRDKQQDKVLDFPIPHTRTEKPADWDAWQDTLSTLRKRGWITVAHDNDNHFPDHDTNAVNMRYRLYARKQPDVIVVGSDCADFSVMSKFEGDPDTDEGVDDALYQFREYWKPHIDNLNTLCPNAVKVFLFGNHEARILNYLHSNAPKLRRTVEDAWLQTIRYGGVQYIGRTEEVDIGPLLVMHGNRANEHTAKSLLDDQSYQVSVMAGHVHRLTSYAREGRRYMVSAITAGCAQQLLPEYVRSKGRSMTRKWQHGVAFATVDMAGTFVEFENIRFATHAGRMVAVSNGDVLEQAVSA